MSFGRPTIFIHKPVDRRYLMTHRPSSKHSSRTPVWAVWTLWTLWTRWTRRTPGVICGNCGTLTCGRARGGRYGAPAVSNGDADDETIYYDVQRVMDTVDVSDVSDGGRLREFYGSGALSLPLTYESPGRWSRALCGRRAEALWAAAQGASLPGPGQGCWFLLAYANR